MLSVLLALLAIGGNTDKLGKAIAGAKLASEGAKLGGYAGAAGGLGLGAGAAGFGLNLANLAKSNLSTRDKVGEGVGGAFDLGASYAIPYYGQAKLVSALGKHFQRSGSPQVRGVGRAAEQVGEPRGAAMFARGIRGHGPWEAGGNVRDSSRDFVLDLLGPLGVALQGAGIGNKVAKNIMDYGPLPGAGWAMKKLGLGAHEPTQGTKFRRTMEAVFKRLPGFETFEGGASKNYDLGADQLAKLDQRDVAAATQLAKLVVPLSKEAERSPEAYTNQLRNMLLNMYSHPGELTTKLKPALSFLMSGKA